MLSTKFKKLLILTIVNCVRSFTCRCLVSFGRSICLGDFDFCFTRNRVLTIYLISNKPQTNEFIFIKLNYSPVITTDGA